MTLGGTAPLDLSEVFADRWVGPAVTWRPWWLRWVPLMPTRFDFTTEAIPAEGDDVVVRDTQTFPNGKVWVRTMRAELLEPGRWRMSADDMPGGAEITVSDTGFTFTPYRIWVPILGPIKVRFHCTDEVRFTDENSLTDTIVMRFLGIRVGVVTMQLQRG